MPDNAILQIQQLGFPWETADPFLFCVHHDDAYPKGNGRFGPDAPLAGRNIGQDFGGKDGWNMYHGEKVPGFPSHPHRGFETVTIVRRGLTDHSDSLGAAARFGGGDVQWLTAGKGIVHSEMFPLLATDRPNPLELFQIWLNLPARSKMCEPHFTMLWAEDIPHRFFESGDGAITEVAVIAGRLADAAPLAPPPDSWAAQAEADVAIWTLRMAPGARWKLPSAASAAARRRLYFFQGASVSVAGQAITRHAAIELRAASAVELVNTGADVAEFLMLQGRPIGEPVAQYGPFVMNTQAELQQAFADYRRTEFGGWPWPDHAPVHGPERVRFARHADGRVETLPAAADDRGLMANVTPPDVADADEGEAVASSAVLSENASRGMQ
jgi:redox-sensitive bicupin YhaK (pirin superfamily)